MHEEWRVRMHAWGMAWLQCMRSSTRLRPCACYPHMCGNQQVNLPGPIRRVPVQIGTCDLTKGMCGWLGQRHALLAWPEACIAGLTRGMCGWLGQRHALLA
eukprot:365091-Chlamydomonas_euryale.AAC.23